MKNSEKAASAGRLLARHDLTLVLAESCTGGMLGSLITAIPGSSRFFHGAIVAYHNRVKKKILKVPPTILRREGAVSATAARAMARGARKVSGASIGLSVTGVAGPGGGSPEKPVGLVYIALDARGASRVHRFLFTGSRAGIRRAACGQALELLSGFAREKAPGRKGKEEAGR